MHNIQSLGKRMETGSSGETHNHEVCQKEKVLAQPLWPLGTWWPIFCPAKTSNKPISLMTRLAV